MSACGASSTRTPITATASSGLWLVADGMGGHEYGEVASALAREAIVREIRDGTPLAQAIRIADEEIIRASEQRNDALPMGTTVVAVAGQRQPLRGRLGRRQPRLPVARRPAGAAVAGPQLRAGTDRQGAISVEQARSHPHRNVVTQALGVTDPQNLNVETMSGELRPGMQLLLCSDGLTEEVDDRGISQVLAHTDCSAQECVDGLVAAALDGGGSDNVTVVLVRRH